MGATYQFSESTMLIIRVVSSVLQLIGILLSLFRLWFRLKIQRLWWEDAWSLVACVSAIAVLTAEWMYLEGDWQVSVVGFWIYSVVFTCVIWAVRMSILYSVARIAHSTKRMRRMVTALAALFSVFFLSFTAMKVWWFSHDLSWLEQPSFYTKPASWMPYSLCVYELCTDCISDTILIFLPVRLLWKMDLPPKHRRMIIAIFSSSVIVTAISILRGVSEIQNQLSLVGVATDFQAACATINCNLLVVATLIYRFSRHVPTPEAPESDAENSNVTPGGNGFTSVALTTVDLSALDCSVYSGQPSTPDTSGA